MTTTQHVELPQSQWLAEAELKRFEHEVSLTEHRAREAQSAIRTLTQRESSLVADLDRAVQFTTHGRRSAAEIAVELGAVRLGIVELERLHREANRRHLEFERRSMDLRLAMSSSGSR